MKTYYGGKYMQCIYQAKRYICHCRSTAIFFHTTQEGKLPRKENVEKRVVQINLTGVLYATFFFKKEEWDHKRHNFHSGVVNSINCYMCSEIKSLGIVWHLTVPHRDYSMYEQLNVSLTIIMILSNTRLKYFVM